MGNCLTPGVIIISSVACIHWAGTELSLLEYSSGNGQLSDVTGSAHVMGRYLANAITGCLLAICKSENEK